MVLKLISLSRKKVKYSETVAMYSASVTLAMTPGYLVYAVADRWGI